MSKRQPILKDIDLFGNELLNANKISVNLDAIDDNDLPRLRQVLNLIEQKTDKFVDVDELELEVRNEVKQEVAYEAPIAVKNEINNRLSTTKVTFSDNITIPIPLTPVQEIIMVLYSIESSVVNEKGVMTINETNSGYEVSVKQYAKDGEYGDQFTYSAHADNGSLVLNVIGNGDGLLTTLKYRVNNFNTLNI